MKAFLIQHIDTIISLAQWIIGGIASVFVVLIGFVWWLVRQKFRDIDNKRDKETCEKMHEPIDVAIGEFREFILTYHHSPRDFSGHGKAIFIQSRIQSWVDSKLDELCKKIKAFNPENVYDVEVMADKVVNQYKNDEAFMNGAKKADVSVENIILVAGVYLGRKYIERNPDLPDPDIK